jgi:DNA-binding NarL/FixJ family response regulator
MNHERTAEVSGNGGDVTIPDTFSSPEQLLAAFVNTSAVGFAVCDRQLRFQGINNVLAAINGIPPKAHFGKSIREVLGEVAAKVEPLVQRVFATGQTVLNCEIAAQLPTRSALGYWIASFLPIKHGAGRVGQVISIVVEVTAHKKLEERLHGLAGKVLRTRDDLARLNEALSAQDERAERLAQSVEELENCIRETSKICRWAQPTMLLAGAEQPNQNQVILPPGKAELFDSCESTTHRNVSLRHLSAREREVTQLLAKSKSNKEVSSILGISVKTVETYRARVMLKLDLHSLAELVRYAVRHKMIEA